MRLIELAKRYDRPGYDCDCDTYLKYLLNWFKDKRYRFYLLTAGDEAAGFTIVRRDTGLYDRVFIVDMFVDKAHRGNGYSYLMAEKVAKDTVKCGAKKVVWQSKLGFWDKQANKTGYSVETETVYTANFKE